MLVNYKEIFKLKVMLDEANIPYEFLDRSMIGYGYTKKLKYPFYQIIVYDPEYINDEDYEEYRLISVIQGYGTCGANNDLLEIKGCMTEKEEEEDIVLGYLSADEVFERIKKNYFKD